jgi:arylsulfatase
MDNRAVRSAEWTLAEVDGAGWELFNTKSDPLETTNLAESKPDLVAAMSERWLTWWKKESGKPDYQPESTGDSPHYQPQGDKGSGKNYTPSAMPATLADRYPIPR